MRIPRISLNSSFLVTSGALIAFVSLWTGQATGWLMPASAAKEAVLIDDLFKFMLIVSTGIFVGVQGMLLYMAFAFRREPSDLSDGPHTHGNIKLEILWTVIPTVLVLYLAVYSFDVFQQIGASAPMGGAHHDSGLPVRTTDSTGDKAAKPMVIQVQAMQFAWIFTYPEKGITTAELHVPVDRPVKLEMKSPDVIHAFWVPQFRLKQDVIPGRTTYVSFTATRKGQYPLRCAELCGPYHGGMVGEVFVEDQKTFDQWLSSQAAIDSTTRIARAEVGVPATLPGTLVLQSKETRALVGHLRTQGQ